MNGVVDVDAVAEIDEELDGDICWNACFEIGSSSITGKPLTPGEAELNRLSSSIWLNTSSDVLVRARILPRPGRVMGYG